MNNIDPNVYNYLEINNVIPFLDRTVTLFGKTKFVEMFNMTTHDTDMLLRRQHILQSIMYNPLYTRRILSRLKKIKKYQKNVSWLFTNQHKEYDDMYISNSKDILSSTNFLKTYMPLIVILLYIVMYILLFYKGNTINLITYMSNIHNTFQTKLRSTLETLTENENLSGFLVNILAKLYVFYQIYSVFSTYNTSITLYKKRKEIYKKIYAIREIIDNIQYIYKNDVYMEQEKVMVKPMIDLLDARFKRNKISSLGYTLLLIKNREKYEHQFNTVLQYVGILDSLISITRLFEIGYILPTYLSGPKKICVSGWDEYGNSQNTTITENISISPNQEAYYKNIMLAMLLSQVLGVSNINIEYTPMVNFFINDIRDTSQPFFAISNIPVESTSGITVVIN